VDDAYIINMFWLHNVFVVHNVDMRQNETNIEYESMFRPGSAELLDRVSGWSPVLDTIRMDAWVISKNHQ
jgi:hypothetical protein